MQLHASVQKWKQLSEKGFDIASKLANSCVQEKYAHFVTACVQLKAHYFLLGMSNIVLVI